MISWFVVALPVLVMIAIAALLSIPAGILIFLASRKMARLESYGFCVFAGVLAVIPFHAAFLVTLPIGIWCLATLQRPEIKLAFAANRRQVV